jgi:hypothetical protein
MQTHVYCCTIHNSQIMESAKVTIHTMKFCSAIKNKIISFAAKWMKLEIIMLSKISQSHTNKYQMFTLICGL